MASIEIIPASTAAEFWSLLSPEKPLFPRPCKLLYRGQADHSRNLEPSILRRGISAASEMQVFKEWAYLETFVRHCDSIGLAIPNDSPAFRERYLNQKRPGRAGWPGVGLAANRFVPAARFRTALRSANAPAGLVNPRLCSSLFCNLGCTRKKDATADRLAVWILDIEKKPSFRN